MEFELQEVKNHNERLNKMLDIFLDFVEPKDKGIKYINEMIELGMAHVDKNEKDRKELAGELDLPFTDECHKAEREIYDLLLKRF